MKQTISAVEIKDKNDANNWDGSKIGNFLSAKKIVVSITPVNKSGEDLGGNQKC